MAKKRENKVTRARQVIGGFLALIAVGFLVMSFYFGTDLNNLGPAVEGEDYTLLDTPLTNQRRDSIEVIEYFSYRCIHCMNFEPFLKDWLVEIPENVNFARQHVVFSTSDELFARTHLAIQQSPNYPNLHNRLFSAIHERQKQFTDVADIISYLEDYDLDPNQFNRSFTSTRTDRRLTNNRSRQARSQLTATPSLLVSGKYLISMNNGQPRALEVASELIEREKNLKLKNLL